MTGHPAAGTVPAAALLVLLATGGCGKAVDPSTARAACAPDQRVHDALVADPALRGVVGGATPTFGGVAPEYDRFTRQCATSFVTVTWTDVALPPADALLALRRQLVATGWRETNSPAVARAHPLLRGYRRTAGTETVELRVELDPQTRTLTAQGGRDTTS